MAVDLNIYPFGRRGLSPPLSVSKNGKIYHSIVDQFSTALGANFEHGVKLAYCSLILHSGIITCV